MSAIPEHGSRVLDTKSVAVDGEGNFQLLIKTVRDTYVRDVDGARDIVQREIVFKVRLAVFDEEDDAIEIICFGNGIFCAAIFCIQ